MRLIIFITGLNPGDDKTLHGKKVLEVLPDLACCEKEEMVAYHPFEKILETYCPVHGGKIFNKDLDELFHQHVDID